jgi:hypothetical protein
MSEKRPAPRLNVPAAHSLRLSGQALGGSDEARRRSRMARNGRKGKVKWATAGESQHSVTAEKLSGV